MIDTFATLLRGALVAATLAGGTAAPAATPPAFGATAVAVAREAATAGEGVAAFYRDRGFAPVWLGEDAAARRSAFLDALSAAPLHGLPGARFDPDALRGRLRAASGPAGQAAAEMAATRLWLDYARAVSAGVIDPSLADPTIVLERPERDVTADLAAFAAADDPGAVLRGLVPSSPGYARLLAERLRLDAVARAGGWGPVVPGGETLAAGSTGPRVAALHRRLGAMGYMRPSPVAAYGPETAEAVRRFQADHGLDADGVAGAATLAALNVTLQDRAAQVVVNLERRRWMNRPLEPRHVLVNVAEQRAYVIDDGVATFETVVVVGAPAPDRRTPEFSDTMTHMVVNPTWYVPRSIATQEYLPQLQRGGARHLEVRTSRGRVDPDLIDFTQFTADDFPFSLRQPPGPSNALGKVKFMFPNRHNIYLHDTPAKSLFGRGVRTFSHGCIRVGRPFALAHHLLAPQEANPEGAFRAILNSGAERQVDLDEPIGVHLVYWSAWVGPDGRARFRGDPYGRDAAVLRALRAAGVAGLDGPAGQG